jgi:GntR family transcriptional regulator of vanillate catabolism
MPKRSVSARRPRATESIPVDVTSQIARAFVGIREMLLRGEFARGERISELPLVARLGMSRTPIRLALDRLAHGGLLQISSSGGFAVREFTIAEVRDAINLRGVLEGTAARSAAERLTDSSELQPLRAYFEQMDALDRLTIDSFSLYLDINEAFHAEIRALAKNEILSRTLEQVISLPFASPSAMVFPTSVLPKSDQTLTIAQEHHRILLEAISQRQGARAEWTAREHALVGLRVLELALSNDDALNRVPGKSLIRVAARGPANQVDPSNPVPHPSGLITLRTRNT